MEAYPYFRSGTELRKGIVALMLSVLLFLPGYVMALDVSDNFNDNLKNTAIWGNDTIYGNGVLKEINQRLEYAVTTPTSKDYSKRPLIARGAYNANWEAQIDLFNGANPTKGSQVNSFGIDMWHCEDPNDWLYIELYAFFGPSVIKAFGGQFATNDVVPPSGFMDSGDRAGSKSLKGAVQMVFDSTTKVVSVNYSVNGGLWEPLGSFGVNGAGGTTANGNWQMTDSHQFCMRVYGYSENMAVAAGKMYGDNFVATNLAPTRPVLVQPNGGEIVPAGEPYLVTWEAPAKATKFKLQLSVDNGQTWSTIADSVPGPSYSWTVIPPSNNKKQCLVKVTAFDANNGKVGSDKSDSPFAVEVLKLTSPNGGEPLMSNSTHTITWTTNGTAAKVDHIVLSYTVNNGQTWKTIDTSGDAFDDGTFNWQVPVVTGTKGKCKVKLVLKDGADKTLGSDVSDKAFSINP